MSGNTYTSGDARIKRVTVSQVISPKDCDGLREFADELRNCGETLKTKREMVNIVERLPMYLRSRWLREVQSTRKRFHVSPDIEQLIGFAEEAATESNDPVYGQLFYSPHERRQNNIHYSAKFTRTCSVHSCGQKHTKFPTQNRFPI